jgi:hypothetical protein
MINLPIWQLAMHIQKDEAVSHISSSIYLDAPVTLTVKTPCNPTNQATSAFTYPGKFTGIGVISDAFLQL